MENNYEQKYRKALDNARLMYEAGNNDVKHIVGQLFPELKEPEDEKVRKKIIDYFRGSVGLGVAIGGVSVKDMVSWLEKQGKSKPIGKLQVSEELYEHIRNTCACIDDALSSETLADVNNYLEMANKDAQSTFDLLEKQKSADNIGFEGQKKINLVEILKHYPKETELYSPLYGKLWLAEVDEKNEIITCYKHHLEEGCTRAVLEQENTVSFYSNGTTGLPDFNVSKDCMLFLYDITKQGKKEPILFASGEDWKKLKDKGVEDGDELLIVKA